MRTAVRRGRPGTVRQRLAWADLDIKASDGLTTFAVMWGVALIFSVVSHYESLLLQNGLRLALLQWGVLSCAGALVVQPRRLSLLAMLAGAMAIQYLYRLPVASNNQTITFFMNSAIVVVTAVAFRHQHATDAARSEIYERLRIVARYLLAIMYFYGIFHKINSDFLDPEVSCAVALYKPLTAMFGLEDNLLGRYGAIYGTFVIEGIAIFCLFARRYFAYGLIIALVFHYIIPISAYSWYMDFSALVFALYALCVPREVSVAMHRQAAGLLRRFSSLSAGGTALMVLAVSVLGALLLASLLREHAGGQTVTDAMVWHSTWIIIWAIVGGAAMLFLTKAALDVMPYQPMPAPRQPRWIYAFPAVLFVSCLSPYFGLKTESSIAMFSNLHTEGGTTNHLVFSQPMYLFDYQQDVATIEASSDAYMQSLADRGLGMVRFELERWMKASADEWVTFTMNGQRFERATAANYPIATGSLIERRLLTFKPVDVARPNICTH